MYLQRINLLIPLIAFLIINSITIKIDDLAHAQQIDGMLDTSFGSNGLVTTNFAGSFDGIRSIAIQANGKIVAAGTRVINTQHEFILARYESDGTIDTSFGINGLVVTGFSGTSDVATSVSIQPDGRIVAVGNADIYNRSQLALARYNSDGSLDTSFGDNGIVHITLNGGSSFALDSTIDANGKIVVVGYRFANPIVARFNYDGSIDTSFGLPTDDPDDGDTRIGFWSTVDFASPKNEPGMPQAIADCLSVAIQTNGKIVASAQVTQQQYYPNESQSNFGLVRLNTDGSLDTSFGREGLVITDFAGTSDAPVSIAIQADGKIVAAGYRYINDTNNFADFAIARYHSNGLLDTSFDGDGLVTTDFAGTFDRILSIDLQVDGKIVAVGHTSFNAYWVNTNFALARYNTNGSLDDTFGIHGRVVTDFFGGRDIAYSVAIQSDGKLVAAGESNQDAFALARYTIGAFSLIIEADVAPRPNGSGTVVVSDWVQIGRFSVGLDTPALGSEFQRADCAPRATLGDGQITVADWVQAGRYSVGLDPVTDVGGPIQTGGALTLLAQSRSAPFREIPRSLRISEQILRPGLESISVPVELTALGGENALSFTLGFDSKMLRFEGYEMGRDAQVQAQVMINKRQLDQGRVGIGLALRPGGRYEAGIRDVIRLKFKVIESVRGLEDVSFVDGPTPVSLVSAEAEALPVQTVRSRPRREDSIWPSRQRQ